MSTRTHMVKSFDDELNLLKTHLAAMGGTVGVQLKYAVQAPTNSKSGFMNSI